MNEKSAVEVLRAVRTKLAEPASWIQHDYARDAAGRLVLSRDPGACSWCLLGAVLSESSIEDKATSLVLNTLREVTKIQIDVWNDQPGRTHGDVIVTLDHAILLAEQGYDPNKEFAQRINNLLGTGQPRR